MQLNKFLNGIALATFCVLLFGACHKKDTTTPTPANGMLAFHLHNNIDTSEVDAYGDTLMTSTGRKIIVNKAQLYMSGFQLIKTDGSVVSGPSTNILKTESEEQYVAGSAASGNYKTVKFNVGLSAATNASMPASSDSTLNRPDMWFGASAQPNGFVFVNFQGLIDTSTVQDGLHFVPFSYKIGTNTNLKSVTMPDMPFTVTPNQTSEVHLWIEYDKLFDGIQLNVPGNLQINTPADNATTTGMQVANNIPSMFVYEM